MLTEIGHAIVHLARERDSCNSFILDSSLYGEAKCQAIMWKDFTDYPHDTQVIHSYVMTPRWEIDILKYQSFVEMFI